VAIDFVGENAVGWTLCKAKEGACWRFSSARRNQEGMEEVTDTEFQWKEFQWKEDTRMIN
jgi:hypothetical protein